MGALLAGVFCGVLKIKVWRQSGSLSLMCTGMRMATEVYTHGAVASGRRFLMGSAIVSAFDRGTRRDNGLEKCWEEDGKEKKVAEKKGRDGGF